VQLEEAREKGDLEAIKRYSQRTSFLTKEMIAEAKELILAMGIPVVEAPSEAEAEAAHLVKIKKAYAVGTQDADAFLFGAPRIIKNLTVSGRRRVPNTKSYMEVFPEIFELETVLRELKISQDQLIALGMLSGTDYSPKGIPDIGPKKALKLVVEHKENFDALFSSVEWNKHQANSWETIFDAFKNIPVSDFDLKFKKIDQDKIREILCEQHDFSNERIVGILEKFNKSNAHNQEGLSKWF